MYLTIIKLHVSIKSTTPVKSVKYLEYQIMDAVHFDWLYGGHLFYSVMFSFNFDGSLKSLGQTTSRRMV